MANPQDTIKPPKGGPTKPPKDDKPTKQEKKADKKLEKQAQKLYDDYAPFHPGGAPYSLEFIQAALEQGLNPNQVKAILNSQALGGPTTGEAFSSPELLDYFMENPDQIGALFDAVKASADAPDSYAEYLAAGGQPGGYQSANQVLQAAVLGIGGAKDAYIAGTEKAKWLAEGNDPAHWYAYKYHQRMQNQAPSGPSYVGGFDVPGAGYDYNSLNQFGMGDVLSHFMQAQQNKALVEQSGAFFDTADFAAESEA